MTYCSTPINVKQSLCASAATSNQDDEEDEYAAVQKEFDKNVAEKKRQQLEGKSYFWTNWNVLL